MPTVTPLIKVNRTKIWGQMSYFMAMYMTMPATELMIWQKEHGYTFVHPFDDLEVATGQGSIAMEIVQELPTVDYIIVPVGGGGLVAEYPPLPRCSIPRLR